MTAPSSIDPSRFLHEQLESASPDLLRQMVTPFMNTLMSAEADAVCGSPYGESSPNRVNVRNGVLRDSRSPATRCSAWTSLHVDLHTVPIRRRRQDAVSFQGWFHVRSSRQDDGSRSQAGPGVAVAIVTGVRSPHMTNRLY